MEFPMHMDDNQLENDKVTLDVCIMLNYNVPAQKSADTEQVEETDNSSKANTAAFNILSPVPQNEGKQFSCLVCSSLYDCQLLCRKHIREKHMKNVTTIVLRRERTEEYSCPDTANNSKLHITSPQKYKKVESPMYIDNNQLGNEKRNEVADMMMNYNVPAQKSADTEQVEETDNSSKANTAAFNIFSPVPQKGGKQYLCLVCSSSYDCRLLCREHIREKHVKNLTAIILRREKTKKYSCPDTADNLNLHVTTPQKNKNVESPMHIDDNQLDNKKDTVDAGMMLNYNVPAHNSADTEQVEETDNSSNANSAVFNTLSRVLQMKKHGIKSLVVSDNGSVILINLKELEEENKKLTP
ncbi:uncharacterized protein LOC132934958 [Metopolophium dirhodum]|uniref:uncharacterized protein LOC132934958 n=1 Tax=Metopolophium dirhodum TaxID=44670 RepID=UPI00298F64F6|nr:uncharacterized protein LOC132934958 [Metopolophium dirhodum]